MDLERAILAMSKDAEDVCAGLQLFSDNVRVPDSGIHESMQELITISQGLLRLRADILKSRHLPPHLEQDVHLVLQSLKATTDYVHRMFGETRSKKLNGRIPYTRIWIELGSHLQETTGGYTLLPRLELLSVFLVATLDGIRGKSIGARKLSRDRDRLLLLLYGQPTLTTSPHSTHGVPLAPVLTIPHNSVNPSIGTPWDHHASESHLPRPGESSKQPHGFPYGLKSPNTSQSPWRPPTLSHTTAGSGSTAGDAHWATLVFDGRQGSSVFPESMAKPCAIYARPMGNMFLRLEDDQFELICKVYFQADGLEIQFWRRRQDGRARIAAVLWSPQGVAASFCIPVTALKLTREYSTLRFFRKDRDADQYQEWASLTFADYERLVLFYSTFVALKHQDEVTPIEDLHYDYFHTERKPEIEKFGGIIVYPPSFRHAFRIYQDRYTRAVRIEARPLSGPRVHVPLWTAFITQNLYEPGWLTRPKDRQVELARLQQYVFFGGYMPTLSRHGKFVVRFEGKNDCDHFVAAISELAAELAAGSTRY